MISIAKPQIGEEEKRAVLKVLESGMLAQGQKVLEFEEKFAQFVGAKYAVTTSSGTTALHLSLMAHGIGPGDEVITSPFSFIASANAILFVGAKPVFVDIEPDYFCIDPDRLEKKITRKTKAIIPVDLYGHPCRIKDIKSLTLDNGVVIEDACQAHGAEIDGKRLGSFATTCFSFYPTKNMTTGEGGMVATNRKKIAEKVRLFREHGSKTRYYHDILGYNFRMTDIAAAIGIAQLKKLERFNRQRIKNAKYLTEKIESVDGIITPKVRKGCRHVFHQYTVRITPEFGKSRDEVMEVLKKNEIGFGIYYPRPIHQQKLYKKLGYQDKLPVAEKMSKEVLSLPIHPGVTKKDLDFIAETIAKL